VDYRIIEKEAFSVVGKALRVSMKDGEQFRLIPQFWTECLANGAVARLTSLAAGVLLPAHSALGICTDFSPEKDQFTYLIAAEKPSGEIDSDLVEKTIPAATWAVFDAVGELPESIQTVWKRIWPEFFGVTDYKHADGPELELYPKYDDTMESYRCEVWIPVEKN
jgi:AraC family transcriptional regulator